MENKEFDEKQGWEIISKMINTSKQNIEDDSIYFLIWGWAVLIAALAQYALIMAHSEYNYLPWALGMPLTALFFIFFTRSREKSKKAKTYIDGFLGKMWTGIGVTLMAALPVLSYMESFRSAYIMVIMLFSMGAAITGSVIRFRPLLAGGAIAWLSALLLLVIDFPNALLVIAFAITASYLVPAYMLRNKIAGAKTQLANN